MLLFALVLLPEVKMVAFTAEADLVTGWCLFGLALLVGGINEGLCVPFLSLPVLFLSSPLTDEASPRSRRLWGEIVSGEAFEFMARHRPAAGSELDFAQSGLLLR